MKSKVSVSLAAAAVLVSLVCAAAPDLTGSLEYLGNPAQSRWPSSSKSRHVQDLQPHRGKIYTSGGEWGNNTGPCPCFAVDPYSGAYVNEFDAGTDAIYEFKEFSDGRLYTSAVDPHENAANIGHTFRRGATGTWYAYRNCHGGNLSDLGSSGYPIHNWDMVEYGDKVFVCGYGISGSTNRCETKMFNATPTLTSSNRKVAPASWTDSSGGKYSAPYGYSLYRRFCAFLPFDDDLFCVTTQPTLKNDRQTWNEWEEWRWDASLNRFNCQTNTWAGVAPGVTDAMMDCFAYSDGLATLQLWHPTRFKDRVLYIVGGHTYNITPVAAYSAVNENHTIKATRLDLGATSVKPFDIYATADAVYLVAAQAGTTTSTVTNSVWKSTDGVAFTPLFTFTSTRQASALCYYDGAFYFGMGANDYTKTCWPKVTGTDVSGRIYRVRLPQEEKPSVVATTDAIATTEGAKGAKAGFRLAVRPATNVTLQVSATHPAIVVSPTQLTFTSADWSTAREVTVDIAEDDDSLADIRGSVVCSAADASLFSGYVAVVATNNDFRAVETAPEGLVDLTSPSGTFEATSGAVTMLPFNDETNLNQTTNRVCIQKTDFSITYDFGTATHVDAYGIYNLACNTQTTRPPKVWTFAGSDDKTAWTQLDQRRYETNWKSGEYRYYSFANAKKYRYYRIAFTANNGDSYTQFAHLEYYSVKPPTDASDDERYTGAAVDNASLRTPGDRTDLLEFVGNPNAARWNEPSNRPVTDLKVYQGKLFVGGGATEMNAGPCPLQHIDPYSKAITVEKTAGTENITLFKELSDGRLYVPSQDPRDYDPDYSDDGHVFVRDPSGDWKFYKNVPKGSAKDTDGKITEAYKHNWDIEEYKGRTFVCGYGISFTTNGCASWTSATPHWTSSRMPCYYPTNVWDYTKKQWKGPSGAASYNTYRREVQFMKFADRLLAIPYQDVPAGIPKQYYDGIVEVHRFDETTQRFVQMTNRCSRVFPGLSTNDFKMAKLVNTYGVPYFTDELKLWHTTPFSNRVFYVVSPYETYTNLWGSARSGYRETQYPYPMFACAADPTDDGLFTSTRLDFGEEEYPFEFLVKGPEMYALTAHYNASDKKVRHTVWRTRDAKNFEQLFTFNFHQYLISMEYYDGKFYFGAGYKGASQITYPLDNTADASGGVYRIPYPLETYSVVAETNQLATVEGGHGTVRFRLAAPPSSAVTLQVRATGDAALLVETTKLTFSSEDWNCWKPVAYRVVQDAAVSAHATGAIVCGAGDGDFTSATVRLTIADDDAAPAAGSLAYAKITGSSAEVSVNVTSLGLSDGVANATAKVVFELFEDASYATRLRAVTNTVTAAATSTAGFTGLDELTRYSVKVSVVSPSGITTALTGNFVTGESEIAGGEDLPEVRNYLVYEGFSTNDYAAVTSGWGTTIQSGPKGVSDSIGTASASTKWDPSGSSQMLWFKPSEGLSLPRAMREKGFKARGTSVGTNPEKNSSSMRSAYRPLAEGVLAPGNTPTGKFCFRALLNVDAIALGVAKKEGWLISASNTTETAVNNYGVAFCRKPTAKNYGATTSEPSTIGFYIARNTNDTARAYVRTVGADGTPKSVPMGLVTPGVTYIFYAEVELKDGGDIVRAGYQSCSSYTNEIPWMCEITNDVFTTTSYPTAMAFGGCYGTNGGYFRADELAVGTKLSDVLAVAEEESTEPDPGTNPDPGPGPGTDPEPPTASVNYWIAAEGSDGLASTPANWSAGVPTAASDIVISPTNSSVTLIWDAAATQTINSYHQYGLTNEVRTTFSTDFPVLTVKGDLVVEGGVLTHPRGAVNVSANVSRLKLSVGGDFTLGTNATVNLKGKGLAGGQKPTGSTAGSHAASCDGYAKVYGNVYRPEHPGSGSNGSNMWGGGALWLEVAGAATIDGTITVRPEEKDKIKQPAAGSVYVKAASCSGTGYIYADYAATGYYEGGAGSGGRVAIELTEATALELAESHISAHGINAGGSNGGGGTIFVKTADPTMSNGTLILDDTRTKSYGARWHKPTAVTAIPAGETWTFDAIKIKNYGVLAIPAGTKLVLPKGIASVTASSTRQGGLLYQGGEIDWGKGPYEFAQPWIFQANKPYTFNGNVTVKADGALGCLQFMGSNDLSDFTKCDVVVNGDLTVEKGGYIWAESAGPDLNVDRTTSAYHGGQTGSLSYAAAYDSILDPSLPGWGMATGDRATSQPGGGVLKLTVNGALTVDGTVTAYANKNSNNSEGAGGTINIRAKTLAGEGSITADSYKFTSQQYAGGGGRIAVRLSEQAVGTDGIFARISAKGATVVTSGGYKPNHSSSAGTVYLQGKDDAEGAGTIRVCNDGNAQSVDPYTPFPSKGDGAEMVDALKDVTLFVGNCAKVKLFETAEVRALALDATGRLDLNGQTLTVASATVNGVAIAAGSYAAGTMGWLSDSSADAAGRLVVAGGSAPSLDPVEDRPAVADTSIGFATTGTAGSQVFTVSVGNIKAGLYYTAFTAGSLTAPFVADTSLLATATDAARGLGFALPTTGKPALFVKIIVSTTPYAQGAVLK